MNKKKTCYKGMATSKHKEHSKNHMWFSKAGCADRPGSLCTWGLLSHLTPDSYQACPEQLCK